MVHFHLGKILKVIKSDKEVISSDSSVQAIVEMWDENQMVLGVEAGIAPQLKVNDIVLVDYNPMPGIPQPIPKQQIVKIVRGKQAKDCWDIFKKYHAEKKNKNGEEQPAPGISYSR